MLLALPAFLGAVGTQTDKAWYSIVSNYVRYYGINRQARLSPKSACKSLWEKSLSDYPVFHAIFNKEGKWHGTWKAHISQYLLAGVAAFMTYKTVTSKPVKEKVKSAMRRMKRTMSFKKKADGEETVQEHTKKWSEQEEKEAA